MSPRPLALTMGDPAGIGGELALKAWLGRGQDGLPSFYLLDDPNRISRLADALALDVELKAIAHPSEANKIFNDALPIFPLSQKVTAQPGHPDSSNAAATLQSIELAVAHCRDGVASAVVTNPISKEVLIDAGFKHPGHTEFLAELAGGRQEAIMMLACDQLKVVPVTIHCALRDAITQLSQEKILHAARTTAQALIRDFGIENPRLVMAGLNPHAGENGKLGREELEIQIPAAEILRAEGIDIGNPLPADSLFHESARSGFDAALCMYHDQALIPIKTIDFESGVNVTLGLPFVRTSPDHGTAFGIAGKGIANKRSLVEAMKMAAIMAERREAHRGFAEDG